MGMTPQEIVSELDRHIVGQAQPSARWRSRCGSISKGLPHGRSREHPRIRA